MKPEWLPRDIIAPANEAERDAVRVAQRVFGLAPTGELDEPTRASLRGLQRFYHLEVNGCLDGPVAGKIDQLRPWRLGDDE